MKYKAVIFDLDGTLLNTLSDIANAVNRVLSSNNFPNHPIDAFRDFIGNGALKLIERALPKNHRSEELIVKCYNEFRKDYGQHWQVDTSVYDGIEDTLAILCDRGIRLSLLSNKPHEYTLKCVDAFLSNWPFELVLGQKDDIPKKPDPAGALMISRQMEISPNDFIFLGDSGVDMKTAVAAGMFPVGALWGFRPQEELIQSGAIELLSQPLEILAVLES